MDENKLLAALVQSRKAWERTCEYLSREDFSAAGMRLKAEIDRYYEEDEEANYVDPDIIAGRVGAAIKKKDQRDALLELVDELYELDVSAQSVATYAIELRRRRLGLEASQLLINNADKELLYEKLSTLTGMLENESLGDEHEVEERPHVETLYKARSPENRIPIAPGALNAVLKGGCLRGHHVIVFARPEIGKTLFCINMAAFLVRRGYRVLWIENEDPVEDIWQRFYSRLTGVEEGIMGQDPEKYEAQLKEQGIDNMFLYEAVPGNVFEIRRKVEEIQPDVLIVNQIRNLNVNAEGRVNQLERAAQEVRTLGKEYDMVTVSVTQAGDSAENKIFLEMGDVDFSNTGVPSAADLMIGIGADIEMKKRGIRKLNLCKNKVSGRHADVDVIFENEISKVQSMET